MYTIRIYKLKAAIYQHQYGRRHVKFAHLQEYFGSPIQPLQSYLYR
ncbi:hypothetical protein [Listeria kieliensis]|nr:hypothetical protein [Listeria kieliensis]